MRKATGAKRENSSLIFKAMQKDKEEEEEFITSGNSRGKHNSLSRGVGADISRPAYAHHRYRPLPYAMAV